MRGHVLILLLSGLVGIGAPSGAQTRQPSEYEVKAVFLHRFASFMEWPASSGAGDETFPICVLGADPFGAFLERAAADAGEIGGRRVAIRRLLGPSEADGCRILYISPSEDGRLARILEEVEGLGVLTVGEGARFASLGGMIGFDIEDERMAFIINLGSAERSGFRIDSRLLNLARTVIRAEAQP